MDDKRTYSIYGIGEIYDEDIPETYRGNMDKIKKTIESGLRNAEKILESNGYEDAATYLTTDRDRRIYYFYNRDSGSGIMVTDAHNDPQDITHQDIIFLAENIDRLELKAENYRNIKIPEYALPQRHNRTRRLDDIIKSVQKERQGGSYEHQRKEYDRREKGADR